MMRRKQFSVWTVACLSILSLALLVSGTTPVRASAISDDIKSTIDEVTRIVKDPAYKGDTGKRRAKLRGIINPKFDYFEMGKRALGAKDWKARTRDEKKRFVDLFGQLLENSYASKIESYQEEVIQYGDEVIKGKYAMVKTKIIRKDDSINVDYKLINRDKGWRIYDFVIEDVSMVRNYRSQFSKIIRKDSFAELISKLSKKVSDLEQGDTLAKNDKL